MSYRGGSLVNVANRRRRRRLVDHPGKVQVTTRAGSIYLLYDPIADTYYCAHAQTWVTRYRVFQHIDDVDDTTSARKRGPPHRWHPDEIIGQSARDLCAVATRYTHDNITTLRSVNMIPSTGIFLEIGTQYDLGADTP